MVKNELQSFTGGKSDPFTGRDEAELQILTRETGRLAIKKRWITIDVGHGGNRNDD